MGRKWTNETLAEEALKYSTRAEFVRGSKGAYHTAHKRGIIDEICWLMIPQLIYWTDEMLAEEALKYETRKEFERGSKGAYTVAHKRGLLDEICWLMIPQYTYWTDEMLAEEALKYSTRMEFVRGSKGAYHTALNRGLLDEICKHMDRGIYGFNPEKPGTLYYLAVDTRVYGTLYKIGITNYDVQTRFCNGDLGMIRVLQTTEYESGQDAYAREQAILKEYAQYRFDKPDQILSSGNTELFTRDILGLDQQRMAT